MYVINNTIYGNLTKGVDFATGDYAHVFRNNACFLNVTGNWSGAHSNAIIDHNSYDGSWQPLGPVASASDFLSTSSTGMDGARGADGSLPNLNFLKLDLSSDLIGAGVAITTPYSIPYTGPHPDLGAYESSDNTRSANQADDMGEITGVEDQILKGVMVYPNPVTDKLNIAAGEGTLNASFKLYDSRGVLLREGLINGIEVVDMSSYSPGLYILHVKTGGVVRMTKIIK